MVNKSLKNTKLANVVFEPRNCPKCNDLMSVRHIGVWGYWCNHCSFWWGAYDDSPKETKRN